MQHSEILTLFDYHYWAFERIFAASAQLAPGQFTEARWPGLGSLRDILTHALDGECGWRGLLQHGTLDAFRALDSTMVPDLAALRERWQVQEQAMRAYLADLANANLSQIIRYQPPDAPRRERMLWHCLVHVVNHGTQHRSEAAALLTSYDCSPAELDLTAFLNTYTQA